MKHRINKDQRGAAHLVLILAFVALLVGALGFLGYNAWQKQNANAGGEQTVGRASNPHITVNPASIGFWRDYVSVVEDKGGKAVLLPADSANREFQIAEVAYRSKDPEPYAGKKEVNVQKFGDFLRSEAGKKVSVCALVRVDKAVTDGGIRIQRNGPFLSDNQPVVASPPITGSPTEHYKSICQDDELVGKEKMDNILANRLRGASIHVFNATDSKLFVRSISIRVVE